MFFRLNVAIALCACVGAVESVEPPRRVETAALENLVAFAKLAGYVRYFHPSDQAANTSWDSFFIDGARSIESASSADDLARKLQAMFDPIAPTVRVFATGSNPAVPDELRRTDAALGVTRWQHNGLGIGTDQLTPLYWSKRKSVRIKSLPWPGDFVEPAQTYEAVLGGGVSARVPTTLYTNAQGSLPNRALPAATAQPPRTLDDRATRLAGVMIAYNVFQNFYPYFDTFDIDLNGAFRAALQRAATDKDGFDFARTMRRFVAALQDGHGYVYYPAERAYMAPVVWTMVEGQVVITRVKNASIDLKPGDRVVSIDGQDVLERIAEQSLLEPASTPHRVRYRAVRDAALCGVNATTLQIDVEPFAAPGTRRTFDLPCGADTDFTEQHPAKISELENGIMYVDIGRVTAADLASATGALAAATGIVYDFRGYPQTSWNNLLGNLITATAQSERFFTPTPSLPDQTNMTYAGDGWTVTPKSPHFNAKLVFLTNASAISQTETDLDIVEDLRLGDIVGEPTAGTTGDINPFTLPGGVQVIWTDLRVLKPNGSQFQGVGIRPTIPVARTRAAIARGVDEILARGIEVLKGAAASAPAILPGGIANSATFEAGPIAPGEIVAIFGTGLGPAEGAAGYYDEMGFLTRYLASTRVFFDDVQAPLTYASATQVNAVVPYGVKNNAVVRVEYQLASSNPVTLPVAPTAPGVYATSSGQAVVVNQNGTLNSESNPAKAGEIVTLFATGTGSPSTTVLDGRLPKAGKWPAPVADLAVLLGDKPGIIEWKGEIYAGVLQVNVRVPADAPAGPHVAVKLIANGAAAQRNPTIAVAARQ